MQGGHGGERIASEDTRRAAPSAPSRTPRRARPSSAARRARPRSERARARPRTTAARWAAPSSRSARGRTPRRSAPPPRAKQLAPAQQHVGDGAVRDREPQPVAHTSTCSAARGLRPRAREARAAGAGPAARRGRAPGRRASGSRTRTRARSALGVVVGHLVGRDVGPHLQAQHRRRRAARERRTATHSANGAAAARGGHDGRREAQAPAHERRRSRRRTTTPHAAARMALGPRIDAAEDIGGATPDARRSAGTFLYKGPVPTLPRRRVRRPSDPGRRGPRRHGRRLPRAAARPRPAGRAEAHRPAAGRGRRLPRALRARVARRRLDRPPQRHPDLLRGREHDGALYIAMRYVEGEDLRTLVRARGAAGARRAAACIVAQVGAAPSTPPTRAGSSTATSSRPTSCSAPSDHAYLTDFGLTKRADARTAARRATGRLGRHARLRRARADPRRARRRARRRLRAGLRPLPRADRRSRPTSARATRRRCGRTSTTTRRPPARSRARRAGRLRRRSCAARWPRTPTIATPRPGDLGRAALAAAGQRGGAGARAPRRGRRGRAGRRRRRRSSRPTRRQRCSPPAQPAAAARLWPWALAAVPIAGLALIAALALGGGDGGGDERGRRRAARAPTRDHAGAAVAIKTRHRRRAAQQHRRRRRQGLGRAQRQRPARRHRRRDRQARARQPARRASPAARPPASASSGSPTRRAPRCLADRPEVPSPGGHARSRCRPRARPSRSPPAERAMWVGIRGNPGLLLRIDPSTATRPAKTIGWPTACRTSPSAAARCGSSRRRREHGHARGHRERRPAPDLRRRQAVRHRRTARGAVWVTNNGDDTVTRIDSGLAEHVARSRSGAARRASRSARGAVWVANSIASTRHAHRPADRRPSGDPIRSASNPYGVDTSATTSGSRARSDRQGPAAVALARYEVARRDDAGLQRLGHQARALLVLGQVLDAEALEQRAQVRLDRVDAEVQLVGDAPGWSPGPRTRRACRAARARRAPGAGSAAGRRASGARRPSGSASSPLPRDGGRRSRSGPTRSTSPSRSRVRPEMRAPLTYVPLRDRPSSLTVHSPAIASSSACRRETSVSQGRLSSFPQPRPTLRRSLRASRSSRRCAPSPSRKTRNGRPRRSASMRSRSSAGVAEWACSGDGIATSRLPRVMDAPPRGARCDPRVAGSSGRAART